jgi:hypothetical protein
VICALALKAGPSRALRSKRSLCSPPAASRTSAVITVPLGPADGLPSTCVLKPEWMRIVERSYVGPLISTLPEEKFPLVRTAVFLAWHTMTAMRNRSMWRFVVAGMLAAATVGCGDDEPAAADGGDAGTIPGADGGVVDSAVVPDAALSGHDGGAAHDAASSHDEDASDTYADGGVEPIDECGYLESGRRVCPDFDNTESYPGPCVIEERSYYDETSERYALEHCEYTYEGDDVVAVRYAAFDDGGDGWWGRGNYTYGPGGALQRFDYWQTVVLGVDCVGGSLSFDRGQVTRTRADLSAASRVCDTSSDALSITSYPSTQLWERERAEVQWRPFKTCRLVPFDAPDSSDSCTWRSKRDAAGNRVSASRVCGASTSEIVFDYACWHESGSSPVRFSVGPLRTRRPRQPD